MKESMKSIIVLFILLAFLTLVLSPFYVQKITNDFCKEKGYSKAESGLLYGGHKTIVCCTKPDYTCEVFVKQVDWLSQKEERVNKG